MIAPGRHKRKNYSYQFGTLKQSLLKKGLAFPGILRAEIPRPIKDYCSDEARIC
jgi:hypothetical protein